MADEGRNAEWDEVGRRFGDLGQRLQQAWSVSRAEKPVAEDGGGVPAAFEDLKTSISHTVSDPGVREAAGNATTGLNHALATNLRQLADWIDSRPASGPGGPGGETVSTDKPT